MALIMILGTILLLAMSGLVYLILIFPTKWFVKAKYLKIVRVVLSTLITLLVVAYYLFIPTSNNDETATIEKIGNKYQITLTGQRAYMTHDPISALSRDTYQETLKIIIPRAQGIIYGQEIPTETGYYKLLGTVRIEKEKNNY